MNVRRMAHGVKHLLGNANLLQILFAGVGVVAVHNAGRILKAPLCVQLMELHQILIVVVGAALAPLVHIAPHNGVGVGVAAGLHFPAAIEERMVAHGGVNGIHHHAQVTAGGVFHAHGHINAAGHQPVLLVFHRPGADGDIGQHIR